MGKDQIFILKDRGIIYINGKDVKEFLQNIVTNDINKVSDTSGCFASLLTPQGKYLFDFIIIRHKQGYFLDCEKNRIDQLIDCGLLAAVVTEPEPDFSPSSSFFADGSSACPFSSCSLSCFSAAVSLPSAATGESEISSLAAAGAAAAAWNKTQQQFSHQFEQRFEMRN